MILHIMMDEKFTTPLISFLNENFDHDQHTFLIMSSQQQMRFAGTAVAIPNVVVVHKNPASLYAIAKYMVKAKKIILHGMFNPYIVYLMVFLGVEPKTFWCIWGGDLYDYRLDSPFWKKIKTALISRLGGVITPLEQDYQLARQVYGAKAPCYYCLGPNSVICRESLGGLEGIPHEGVNILVGNSADSENNHMFLLDQLKGYSEENIRLYLPLSYGDQAYADQVGRYAKELFGDKAVPMRDFMPLDRYLEFLRSVDVAVYAHKRQQAFSSIVQLVPMGVKVYLDPVSSIWDFMQENKVQVFDVHTLEQGLLPLLDPETKENNRKNICDRCSWENMLREWKTVFEV